jgi:hypothetical protein
MMTRQERRRLEALLERYDEQCGALREKYADDDYVQRATDRLWRWTIRRAARAIPCLSTPEGNREGKRISRLAGG